jgi:hypothetical protein
MNVHSGLSSFLSSRSRCAYYFAFEPRVTVTVEPRSISTSRPTVSALTNMSFTPLNENNHPDIVEGIASSVSPFLNNTASQPENTSTTVTSQLTAVTAVAITLVSNGALLEIVDDDDGTPFPFNANDDVPVHSKTLLQEPADAIVVNETTALADGDPPPTPLNLTGIEDGAGNEARDSIAVPLPVMTEDEPAQRRSTASQPENTSSTVTSQLTAVTAASNGALLEIIDDEDGSPFPFNANDDVPVHSKTLFREPAVVNETTALADGDPPPAPLNLTGIEVGAGNETRDSIGVPPPVMTEDEPAQRRSARLRQVHSFVVHRGNQGGGESLILIAGVIRPIMYQ